MKWNFQNITPMLEQLLKPGLLGNYRSFEVTELVRLRGDGAPSAINALTVIVADPREPDGGKRVFLSEDPLRLKGTPWKFGLGRYRISLHALCKAVDTYAQVGRWQPGPDPVAVGSLVAIPPQFVPADSTEQHPWNTILKNNFWNGSHVLELFDSDKNRLESLNDNPAQQAALATLIQPFVPWGIDALSDRLGNVIIQVPVTSLVTRVRSSAEGHYALRAAWEHGVQPRPFRVVAELYEDGTVEGIDSKIATGDVTTLALHARRGGARHALWDIEENVLLGASAKTSFIHVLDTAVHIDDPSDVREFLRPSGKHGQVAESVRIQRPRQGTIIGNVVEDPRARWRARRVLRQTMSQLAQTREFVQYGGSSGGNREQALADIRYLLKTHGQLGAWLWDPFLSSEDLLDTLFFSPHAHVDLRALTAGKTPPSPKSDASDSAVTPTVPPVDLAELVDPKAQARAQKKEALRREKEYRAKHVAALELGKGNARALRLEFRIRKGDRGWAFHDRFLIFPALEGPALAWSLGTSINSLGKEHHILQKVADGQLIAHAFLELWDALDSPSNLIWRSA